MLNIYGVRSDSGTYTPHFLKGGYAGIGWFADRGLSDITPREDLYPCHKAKHPDHSNITVGQQDSRLKTGPI
jgi:hypothetical protein